MTEQEEIGIRFFSEVMGSAAGADFSRAAQSDSFGAPIIRHAASACFHDAWGHEGITRKEKSIAIISVLIDKGLVQELKNHIRIGIANGLTVGEIEGILVQLAPYVGFPLMSVAVKAVTESFTEAGVALAGHHAT